MEVIEYRVEQMEQAISDLQEIAPLAIIGFIFGTFVMVMFFIFFVLKKSIYEEDK